MTDHAAAYRGVRERVTALVTGLDAEAAGRMAPATPAWRLKDVVAHMVGVSADVLSGDVEGAGTDPWTARQVEARRDRALADLLAEWDECGPGLEAIIPAIPEGPRGQLIFDAASHEFDVCGALGTVGERDTEAAAIGFGWAADVIALVRDHAQTGALRLRSGDEVRVAGSGGIAATVTADRFELLRAMTGRRSVDQIAAFGWEGESVPDPVDLSFFPPRATPLVE